VLAAVDEGERELVAHLLVRARRERDAARLAHALQPRGDVHAVAVDVVALDQHVAEVDADAEHQAPLRRLARAALEHRALHLRRAPHRVDHARELGEQPVAGGLEDAPAVLGDRRVDEPRAQRLQARERAFLVGAHQAAEADDVGGEDRRQAARRGVRLHGAAS
jgi:hypothetical protein